MCRIAGIASLSLPAEELRPTVAAMCQALRHGGPDDEGLYACEQYNLVLGHRRLALIDLQPTGHQPMHYGDGRYTIAYNGEIYNYKDLRAELKALGHSFRSTSDTEVILAAFAAWGTAAFARFNGMFAFALLDSEAGELYLVRDLLGIKPLYYWRHKATLVFASEVRAFYCLDNPPAEHPHWPVYLMAYGHLPEPVTTLDGVRPLQKGTFLRYSLHTGEGRTEAFDTLSMFEKELDRGQAVRQVAAHLRTAVNRHLVSDAPIGVFLSGGVDSSVIALAAGEHLGERVETLSMDFREKAFSERAYQQKMVDRLSGRHHRYQLEKEEFHFFLPDIIAAMDLPSSDGINTWFIARYAAQCGLKAVLSGLGGDELFGGYPSFHRMRTATRLQKAAVPLLRSFRYAKEKKLRRLAFLSLPGLAGLYLFLRGHFSPLTIARYLDLDEQEVWDLLESEPVLPGNNHMTPENRASWMEMNLYMQNQLLRDTDVMSMTHGVEIRVPMLDKDLVKTTLRLPSAVKYAGPAAKGLLVDAFRRELPREVWDRRKMGFSFPFADWMKEDEWIRSKILSGSPASVRLMQQFERGRLHWSGLMSILLLRTHRYAAPRTFLGA
ncbi:asparagine synthase (glutamine-hydrolyzing) [Flavisolibacter nicotianae]|uniref:asparagine synthase (glutamine-hydrolyzing) n=1 Tax=Flavisolibacter nicotianae TaxID=2364882 RepID=UPI000EADD751|nr:asparagine synthase (glutamine-hydrolyzing) [Flavisolibacter nicotianae]